ncbi:hypothetical protein ADK82_27485 [Streptomyces sp. NRRL S-4]|nr:hypothetical protein ADK82_27485 [Streptomyces sp. NRRL S-4]
MQDIGLLQTGDTDDSHPDGANEFLNTALPAPCCRMRTPDSLPPVGVRHGDSIPASVILIHWIQMLICDRRPALHLIAAWQPEWLCRGSSEGMSVAVRLRRERFP